MGRTRWIVLRSRYSVWTIGFYWQRGYARAAFGHRRWAFERVPV